ncbi:maleylacetate reductase [uncultured Ruegeria sp.]|uniref:maleylacetate reductase n=1 Tax=uncultured Ruegeria sp. TaxID=259304 RepID=UPI002636375B|nr:maleylacetate reductase [uncultured Ruegeria sp.]
MNFTYSANPARVLFGRGTTAKAAEELDHLGVKRALVLTTPQQRASGEAVAEALGAAAVGLFDGATMHTPVDVTEKAMAVYAETKAEAVVSIGGGSTIGLGKAIALRTDCTQLAIPTSYAGSEMTPIIGQTEAGRKVTQRIAKVLPETVIYDVDHTIGLPPALSVTSGMNAVAHAVEALYSEGANPVLSLMAEEGTARMINALPAVIADPADPSNREEALLGAWLCAVCLGTGGIALHHKLAHVLGGSFDLPHAETHTAILPHALAYNAPAVPDAMAALARATGSDDPAGHLYDVPHKAGATMALCDLGMPEDGIERAVRITLETPYPNPRDFDADALRGMLRRAWAGDRPRV